MFICYIVGMDCTFETGFCELGQMQDDEFDWTRQKDSTDTTSTGPGFDHTTGDGKMVKTDHLKENLFQVINKIEILNMVSILKKAMIDLGNYEYI